MRERFDGFDTRDLLRVQDYDKKNDRVLSKRGTGVGIKYKVGTFVQTWTSMKQAS